MSASGRTYLEAQEAEERVRDAAPKLLASLKEAVELFELDDECNEPGTDAYTWLMVARAMIDQAEGRS